MPSNQLDGILFNNLLIDYVNNHMAISFEWHSTSAMRVYTWKYFGQIDNTNSSNSLKAMPATRLAKTRDKQDNKASYFIDMVRRENDALARYHRGFRNHL